MMRDGMFVMTGVATFSWFHLSALAWTWSWHTVLLPRHGQSGSNSKINTKRTHVFFRSYELHSWGDLDDWEESQKHKNESPIHTAPNFNESHLQLLSSQAEVLEQLWGVLQLKASLLDITRLPAYQQDAHIFNYSTFHAMGCSHWCLPGVPDTWNELVYSFLLLRDRLKHMSRLC
jgi:hypothetical protein